MSCMNFVQFFQEFVKRPGTLNLGKENEELNTANLILKLTLDDDIQDFRLSSEDPKFGGFDDIICELQTSKKKSKFAIQIKHVNDEQKKKLKIIDLQKKTGKFSLLTFFNHYLEMEDVCDPFDLILYTNQKFDFQAEKEHVVLDDGTNKSNVVMTKCCSHPLLSTNEKTCCYKFKFAQNHEDKTEIKYSKFFAKFYIYVEQMNVMQLREHIFDKFNKTFCCENDNALKQYLQFIVRWKDLEKSKKKLSKTVMKNVLLFNLLSENIRRPMISKEPVNTKIKTFREAILKFDITIFSKQNEDLVKSIWTFDSNELINDTQAQELIVDYQLTSNDKTLLELQWLMDKYPLLVVDSVKTRKALSLLGSDNKKFILLTDSDSIEDLSSLSLFRNLSDLQQHPGIYKSIVGTFTCAIQLKKNEIPLETYLEENENIKVLITTDKLACMINGPLVICTDKECVSPFYINRYVSKNIINLEFFENVDKDTLILICCWKEKFQLLNNFKIVYVEALLKNNECSDQSGRVIYVSESEGSCEKFEQFCQKMSKSKAHNFKLTEKGELEWVRSKNGIEDLENFRVEGSFMEESELLRYENNINIVCAESGMGKTELMKSLKSKSSYNSWTIMIYARNHSQHFRRKKDDVEAFKEYIIKRIYKKYEEFELKFLKMLIGDTKCIVVRYIWDGLDEVSSKNLKIIMKLIRDLSEEGSKNWITSRNNLKQSLEEYFGALSWTISEFNEDQQQRYIENKLSHLSNRRTENIIPTIRLSSCTGVLGIPLLIYILTELFRIEDSDSRHEWLTDRSFSIAKLYQHFVEEKFYIHYTEKHNFDPNNEVQTERNEVTKNKRVYNYEKVAMKMYFDEETVGDMNVDDFLNKIKSESDHIGIITRVVEIDSPLFLHSSFGEYFAGSYLARHDPQGEKFDLSDRKYKNIRLFRDSLVQIN
jgi:hypothetical protein